MATTIGIQLLNAGTGVILARSLGPSARGTLAAVILWPVLILAIGGASLGDAAAYFSAKWPDRTGPIAGTSLTLSVLQAALLTAVGLFLVPPALNHYGSAAVRAGMIYLAWIPLNMIALTAISVAQGQMAFGLYNMERLAMIVLTFAGLAGAFVFHQLTVERAVGVYVVVNMAAAVGTVLVLIVKGWIAAPRRDLLLPVLWYGLKAHTGNVSALMNERADQAVIALFLPAAQLGLYTVAVTLTSGVSLIGGTFGLIALPIVASAKQDGFAILARFVRLTVLGSGILVAAGCALGPFVIRMLFGKGFSGATGPFEVLIFAAALLSVNRIMSACLRAMNRPLAPGLAEGVGFLVTVPALVVLLPLIGIIGAAVASLLAYMATLFILVWMLRRETGLQLVELLVPTTRDCRMVVDYGRRLTTSLRTQRM